MWLAVLLWSPAAILDAESVSEARFDTFDQYRAILWIGDSAYKDPARVALFFQRLREMGANAGMVYDGGDPGRLVENKVPYYVENVVNKGLCLKWNSAVQDWEAFVTAWHKGRDEASLSRDYCLDDPAWRQWAREEIRSAARRNRENRPIAYDIRDELSVTISANPFDYDFSPAALRGFREWLGTIYPSLDALNRQWETRFASWDEVRPFTTDRIKGRMSSGDALHRVSLTGRGCRACDSTLQQLSDRLPDGTSHPGATSGPTWTCPWPAHWTTSARPRARWTRGHR